MTDTSVFLVLLITGYAGIAVLGARSLLREAAARKAIRVQQWPRQERSFPGSGLDS